MWSESYSLGVKHIDDEHKKLFKIADELKEMECRSVQREEFRKILYEIRYYLKEHFASEEKYMQELHYKGIVAHKLKHEKIIELFVGIMKSTKKLDIICLKLKKFINSSIINHIIYEDTKLNSVSEDKREDEPLETISDINYV